MFYRAENYLNPEKMVIRWRKIWQVRRERYNGFSCSVVFRYHEEIMV